MQKCLKKSGMVPKSQEWWQGIWNINFFRQSLKITSDILRYIRYSALQCHLAAAFCFIINVAWFIFSDLSSDARTSSCLYFKRYIIYGQNSQSQVFQQNDLLKSCIGSLVKSENCKRTASPPLWGGSSTLITKLHFWRKIEVNNSILGSTLKKWYFLGIFPK